MSGRCSPTGAVNLNSLISPLDAAARLTQAIQTNVSFRAWCDGVLIEPHIRAIAKVVPKLDKNEGRWTADVESTGPGLGWARGLPWEFDVDEVKALLADKRPTTQVREGHSKPGSADAWIDHVCPNGEWRLMTPKQIHEAIANYAEKRGWKKFPSYSAVAAALLKRPT